MSHNGTDSPEHFPELSVDIPDPMIQLFGFECRLGSTSSSEPYSILSFGNDFDFSVTVTSTSPAERSPFYKALFKKTIESLSHLCSRSKASNESGPFANPYPSQLNLGVNYKNAFLKNFKLKIKSLKCHELCYIRRGKMCVEDNCPVLTSAVPRISARRALCCSRRNIRAGFNGVTECFRRKSKEAKEYFVSLKCDEKYPEVYNTELTDFEKNLKKQSFYTSSGSESNNSDSNNDLELPENNHESALSSGSLYLTANESLVPKTCDNDTNTLTSPENLHNDICDLEKVASVPHSTSQHCTVQDTLLAPDLNEIGTQDSDVKDILLDSKGLDDPLTLGVGEWTFLSEFKKNNDSTEPLTLGVGEWSYISEIKKNKCLRIITVDTSIDFNEPLTLGIGEWTYLSAISDNYDTTEPLTLGIGEWTYLSAISDNYDTTEPLTLGIGEWTYLSEIKKINEPLTLGIGQWTYLAEVSKTENSKSAHTINTAKRITRKCIPSQSLLRIPPSTGNQQNYKHQSQVYPRLFRDTRVKFKCRLTTLPEGVRKDRKFVQPRLFRSTRVEFTSIFDPIPEEEEEDVGDLCTLSDCDTVRINRPHEFVASDSCDQFT